MSSHSDSPISASGVEMAYVATAIACWEHLCSLPAGFLADLLSTGCLRPVATDALASALTVKALSHPDLVPKA